MALGAGSRIEDFPVLGRTAFAYWSEIPREKAFDCLI